ncbi:MAG: redoxin domain-containing protein [Bacteroidales bacterium]|nr:redoxin domain-containing protein [Bacteroidales bacterium]
MAQYKIHVRIDSIPTPKAYLFEFVGTQTHDLIDSARVDMLGQIDFTLPDTTHPGMYRIVMGPRTWLDFVFNHENVSLRTNFNAPADSLKVVESIENKLFSKYMNFFMVLNSKREALDRLIGLYPEGSEFRNTLMKEYAELQQTDPEEVGRGIISEYPDSYVARFLKIEQNLQVPAGLSMDKELEYLLDHYFDQTDFGDSTLIYSPPLISKVLRYFNIIEQAYPPEDVEKRLITGLNRVLSLAAINDRTYNFLLEELTRVYERSEYETFFAYFTESFLLGSACTDESRNKELAEMLASIKKTTIGIQAPEIILPLKDGPVILSDIKAPYVMILFWASWCPHCNEMLPEIKRIYQQYKNRGFEIVAISIDKDKKEYKRALEKGNYGWINYSELKGWDCSIAYDYGIRATPTMILLDQERKIIAKPRNPKLLRSVLSGLL